MEWCRVTRHPQIFRGLTDYQRTPGIWGVTLHVDFILRVFLFLFFFKTLKLNVREGIHQDPPHSSPMITLDDQGESSILNISYLMH